MPKSEFTAVEILANGMLSASGTTDPPPKGEGGAGAARETHLHVAVVQDGHVSRLDGVAPRPNPTTWSLVGNANGIEKGKEAQVLGLAVQLRHWHGGIAFETFTWTGTLAVKGC